MSFTFPDTPPPVFEDLPSIDTPITAAALNAMRNSLLTLWGLIGDQVGAGRFLDYREMTTASAGVTGTPLTLTDLGLSWTWGARPLMVHARLQYNQSADGTVLVTIGTKKTPVPALAGDGWLDAFAYLPTGTGDDTASIVISRGAGAGTIHIAPNSDAAVVSWAAVYEV